MAEIHTFPTHYLPTYRTYLPAYEPVEKFIPDESGRITFRGLFWGVAISVVMWAGLFFIGREIWRLF